MRIYTYWETMSTTRTAGLPKRQPRRTHRQVAEGIFWTMSIEQLREYIQKYGLTCRPEEPMPGGRTDISWGSIIDLGPKEFWEHRFAERTGMAYSDVLKGWRRHLRKWSGPHHRREKEMLVNLATELSLLTAPKPV